MNIDDLLTKPVWQMTGEELVYLQQSTLSLNGNDKAPCTEQNMNKRYVYGIAGIAEIFGCSLPTANRIKKSGKIDRAVTQIGRKIIVDAELALELAGKRVGGRK